MCDFPVWCSVITSCDVRATSEEEEEGNSDGDFLEELVFFFGGDNARLHFFPPLFSDTPNAISISLKHFEMYRTNFLIS